MKVEYTYEVVVTVDEEKGAEVEKALEETAKKFDSQADVEETDATEVGETEEEGSGTSED